jgi:hypothetical protein
VVIYFFLLVCVLNCAEANLALVSVRCSNLVSALVWGAAMTAINTLFSGFIVQPSQLQSPLTHFVYRASFQTYFFSGLLYNDLAGRGDAVLSAMDMQDTNLLHCFVVLITMTLGSRFGLYVVLACRRPRC